MDMLIGNALSRTILFPYIFFSLFAHKINLLVFFFYFAELTKNKVEEIHKKTGGGLPPNPPSMSEETQIASF